MIIDGINLNQLRIFECVYRTRSMTEAARELHLTQSGVSQHVKALEDVLGVKLFDRIRQRLVPTSKGVDLFKGCTQNLYGLEEVLLSIKDGATRQLSGTVTIGMPIEFGNNMVIPQLAKFARANPRVQFNLTYGFATEISDGLISGTMDFAFVDEFRMDPRLTTEKVYDETLYLCASQDFIKQQGQPPVSAREARKYFEGIECVDYQKKGEPVVRGWFDHHYGQKHILLSCRATAMDVQGITRLVMNSMGVGVLPGHLVNQMQKDNKPIYVFKGSGKPYKNAISVAYLSERTQAPAAAAAFRFILDALKASIKE